jgi:hypothetical protein
MVRLTFCGYQDLGVECLRNGVFTNLVNYFFAQLFEKFHSPGHWRVSAQKPKRVSAQFSISTAQINRMT